MAADLQNEQRHGEQRHPRQGPAGDAQFLALLINEKLRVFAQVVIEQEIVAEAGEAEVDDAR